MSDKLLKDALHRIATSEYLDTGSIKDIAVNALLEYGLGHMDKSVVDAYREAVNGSSDSAIDESINDPSDSAFDCKVIDDVDQEVMAEKANQRFSDGIGDQEGRYILLLEDWEVKGPMTWMDLEDYVRSDDYDSPIAYVYELTKRAFVRRKMSLDFVKI